MLDDAGKDVKILNPAGFADWPSSGDERMDWVVRRVRMASTVSWKRRLILVAIAVCISMSVPLAVLLMRRSFGGVSMLWLLALPVAVFLVIRFGARQTQRSQSSDRIASVMLDEGLCPCCGYNLHGTHADSSAHLTCPECGSTWSESRVRTSAPFVIGDHARLASPMNRIHAPTGKHTKRVHDDAGDTFTLSQHERHRRFGARSEPAERTRVRALRKHILREGAWWRVSLFLIVAGTGAAALFGFLGKDLALFAEIPTFLIVCMLGAAFSLALPSTFKHERRTLLRHGACPICITALPGRASAGDGLITCPGCRARWRADGSSPA